MNGLDLGGRIAYAQLHLEDSGLSTLDPLAKAVREMNLGIDVSQFRDNGGLVVVKDKGPAIVYEKTGGWCRVEFYCNITGMGETQDLFNRFLRYRHDDINAL